MQSARSFLPLWQSGRSRWKTIFLLSSRLRFFGLYYCIFGTIQRRTDRGYITLDYAFFPFSENRYFPPKLAVQNRSNDKRRFKGRKFFFYIFSRTTIRSKTFRTAFPQTLFSALPFSFLSRYYEIFMGGAE